MVIVEEPPPAPVVRLADEEEGEHRAKADDPDEEPFPLRGEPHLRAEVRQDLRDRQSVVALEERGDAQEREEPPLVGGERRLPRHHGWP